MGPGDTLHRTVPVAIKRRPRVAEPQRASWHRRLREATATRHTGEAQALIAYAYPLDIYFRR